MIIPSKYTQSFMLCTPEREPMISNRFKLYLIPRKDYEHPHLFQYLIELIVHKKLL